MALPDPKVRVTNGIPVKDGSYAALGYRTLSAGKTAGSAFELSSITGGIPAGANKMLVFALGGDAYWRDDAVDPTVSDGMPILQDCGEWLYTDDLSKVRVIFNVGTSLRASFYA